MSGITDHEPAGSPRLSDPVGNTRPFLFVVGYGRSGTTLLAALLDSHPKIAIPGETSGLLLELCPVPGEDREEFDTEAFVDRLMQHERFRLWNLDRAALSRALARAAPNGAPEAVRALYSFYASRYGKDLYGDKTPKHLVRMRELAALFPEARFVHLIRDGRDCALAMLDASFGPTSVSAAAAEWRDWVEGGRSVGVELGARRYLEVHYEALVSAPEAVLRVIADFLDVEYDEVMLDKEAAVARQLAMSPAPGEDRSLTRPVAGVMRDWRSQMAPADLGAFEALAGPLLAELGYPVGAER